MRGPRSRVLCCLRERSLVLGRCRQGPPTPQRFVSCSSSVHHGRCCHTPPRSISAHVTVRLLDRLEELFLAGGFGSFTIAKLAAGVGCSRRTLYELAPSRSSWCWSCSTASFVARGGLRWARSITAPRSSSNSVSMQPVGSTSEFRAEAYDDLADDPAARRLLDRHYRFGMKVIERLVTLGIERGEFRPVNPSVVAATIAGAGLYLNQPEARGHRARPEPDHRTRCSISRCLRCCAERLGGRADRCVERARIGGFGEARFAYRRTRGPSGPHRRADSRRCRRPSLHRLAAIAAASVRIEEAVAEREGSRTPSGNRPTAATSSAGSPNPPHPDHTGKTFATAS